jgi:hypothetical protein
LSLNHAAMEGGGRRERGKEGKEGSILIIYTII